MSDTLHALPLDADTARKLRANARRRDRLLTERDELIVHAANEGAGLREIARELGMTHQGVKHVLDSQPKT